MATDQKPTGDADLGTRIFAAREAKGLTQAALAKRIGKAQSTVAGYERGADYPSTDTLDAICEVLETSMDWLHGRSVMSNRAEDLYKQMIGRVKRKNLRGMADLDDEDLEDAAAALDAFLESRIQRKRQKKKSPKKKTSKRR